jgi:hypothetical protein
MAPVRADQRFSVRHVLQTALSVTRQGCKQALVCGLRIGTSIHPNDNQWRSTMKAVVIGALAFAFVSGPALAQGVKPEDAAKVAAAIMADKEKLKAYCDMQDLYNQSFEASEKKDDKKAEELAKKADELGAKLGAEYEKLMTASADLDPESKEGQEFYAGFEKLDEACEKK